MTKEQALKTLAERDDLTEAEMQEIRLVLNQGNEAATVAALPPEEEEEIDWEQSPVMDEDGNWTGSYNC